MTPIPDDEFRLAITMAGAGSAGCYTGGVMDYIFEILDLWQRAKDDLDNADNPQPDYIAKAPELSAFMGDVPRHKVVIDAMGGCSAGGMTATMSSIYALNGHINPVKKPGKVDEKKENLFYDSWVLMDDLDPKDKRDTFEKLWDIDDLKDGWFKSLLNSKFIDNIADRSFDYKKKIEVQAEALPKFISKDLQVIFSHCLLRGIPLNVDFITPVGKLGHNSILPNHTTFEHYVISHYHLNEGKAPDNSKFLWLNPYDEDPATILQLSTKATGAFPAGLIYREFTTDNLNYKFLKNSVKRVILGEMGNPDPDPDDKINLKFIDKYFSSLTIDGGAINNEPYREVNSLLKDKYGSLPGDNLPRFGVIMIDPFPDRAQLSKEYSRPDDLMEVIPGIIGALTDQSRIKRREVLENDSAESFRSIIFPSKWEKRVHERTGREFMYHVPTPLASASVMAFGGMMDIKFRQHDYFLGRNNAKNFLRFFFSLPYDPAVGPEHPIHKKWNQAMINRFLVKKEGKKDEYKYFLPIIPDLNLFLENQTAITADRYSYDLPELPKYDPERLFAIRPAMKKRFSRIITLLALRGNKKKKVTRERDEKKLAELNEEVGNCNSKLQELKKNQLPPEKYKDKEDRILEDLYSWTEKRDLLACKLAGKVTASSAGDWMHKKYKKSFLLIPIRILIKGVTIILFFIARPIIARTMTTSAVKKILKDLEDNNSLLPVSKK